MGYGNCICIRRKTCLNPRSCWCQALCSPHCRFMPAIQLCMLFQLTLFWICTYTTCLVFCSVLYPVSFTHVFSKNHIFSPSDANPPKSAVRALTWEPSCSRPAFDCRLVPCIEKQPDRRPCQVGVQESELPCIMYQVPTQYFPPSQLHL